jgi:hypothetical protein
MGWCNLKRRDFQALDRFRSFHRLLYAIYNYSSEVLTLFIRVYALKG